MHVPAGLRQAYLISVPRDLLVAIPPDPAPASAAAQDKINAAYDHGGGGEAGARLLSATLTRLTGLRFDGAALVDFAGFQQVIDLLGGIRMCVDTEVRSIHTGHRSRAAASRWTAPGRSTTSGSATTSPAATTTGSATSSRSSGRCWTGPARSTCAPTRCKLDRLIRAVGASLTVDTNGVPAGRAVFALRGLPAGRADAACRCPPTRRPSTGSPTWCSTRGRPALRRRSAATGARLGRGPTRAGSTGSDRAGPGHRLRPWSGRDV